MADLINWEHEATHSDIDVIKQHIDSISVELPKMSANKFKNIIDEIYDGILLIREESASQRMTLYQSVMQHFYNTWINAWNSSNNKTHMITQFNHLRDLGTWFPQEYRDNGLSVLEFPPNQSKPVPYRF